MGSKRKRGAKETANPEHPSQKKAKVDSDPNPSSHTVSQADKDELLLDKSPFPLDLSKKDHDRERLLYKLLGSEDISDRIRAADVIVSSLLDGNGAPDPVLRRHLERRLFRGLTSGNVAARVGFSYVLTEILRQLFGDKNLAADRYPRLTFDRLLDVLKETTQASGNVSGQEVRDHFWGHLFGLSCFVQAGVLFDDPTRWEAVRDALLELCAKKPWIGSQAAFVIAQAIPQMGKKQAKGTLSKVAETGLVKTPGGLGIWLAASNAYPELKLPKPWKHPLSSKSLPEVASVLKGGGEKGPAEGREENGERVRQANATTQLPFVWDLLVDHFLKKENWDDFKVFWDRTVDQGYFARGASDHQKLTGFKIFLKVLNAGAGRGLVLPNLFSENLMSCLMNQASNATPRLHRAAVQCLKAIEKQVEETPDILAPVLKQLLAGNGDYNFDQRVKGTEDGTKTVERILLFASSVRRPDDIIDTLRTCALRATNTEEETQKTVQVFAEYLFRLSGQASNTAKMDHGDSTPIAALALQELADIAHPSIDSIYPELDEKTRETAQTYLLSSAASLLKRPQNFPHLCKLIAYIDPKAVPMAEDIKSEVLQALERLRELVELDGDPAGRQARRGLAVLHAVSILQLYNDPKPDGVDVLRDIKKCFDKLQDASYGSDSGMAEIVVEVLLAMLASSSRLTRQASLQVFAAFTPFMSAAALEYLTEILAAQESAQGFKALFSNEGEDEEDADDVEETDNEQDEERQQNGTTLNDGDGDDDDASSSGAESDGDDSSDGAGGEDVSKEAEDLEAALMKAYNVSHTLGKDHEAESSDDDADMSDSEMLAMDEQLAGHMKLLQSQGGSKKRQVDEKKRVVEFKHRVLDLLDVYIKKEALAAKPLVFGLLPSLLQLAKATKEPSLRNKAVGVITETQKVLKKARSQSNGLAPAAAVDVPGAIAALEEVHDAAHDPTESKAFVVAASAASLAIASTLFAADRENYKLVADVYRKTQDRWVLGDFSVRASFFTDWHNWCQSIRPSAKPHET